VEPSRDHRLSASNHPCCIDAPVAAVLARVAIRSELQEALAVANTFVTIGHFSPRLEREPAHGPPVSPPSSARPPLVLRI
jgi:hypothetical protein